MSYMVGVPEGGEYLAGDVAFEAADNFILAHPLGGASAHICPGSLIMTQSDDYDAVEHRFGLAVVAAVEAVPSGPDRGSGYGIHAAQVSEGGLCTETLGIAASGHKQGRRRVGP